VDVESDEGNEPDLPQQPEELSGLTMAHSSREDGKMMSELLAIQEDAKGRQRFILPTGVNAT
jgi:hypothetical protein